MQAFFIRNTAAGGNLAVNFNGVGNQLAVVPFAGVPPQMWVVPGPINVPQPISSVLAPGDQTEPVGGFVEPTPAPFGWNIVPAGVPGEFTIQDAAGLCWGIAVPVPGELVALAPPGGPNQNWTIQLAPWP